jgi:nitrilase
MDNDLLMACHSQYLDSAIDADGPELAAIAGQAKNLGLFTYIGFVERASSRGTVYCSLAAIHPDEGIVSIHRKLKPTFFERMAWADGDGHGLQVHPWKDFRVGGLNCFENWQPLTRQALYAQGEQLHVMAWPGRVTHHTCAKFVAMEGRVYVLSVAGVMEEGDVPDDFPAKGLDLNKGTEVLSGGSTIFGPDGGIVAGPLESEEAILYADIDVKRVNEERMRLDPAGHYGRPDVFRLEVDRKRHEHLYETDD